MSFIDSRTVFLLTGMMGGLMALILLSIKRNYPPSIKGLGEWSNALVLMFVAGTMSAVRVGFPDAIVIGLPNLLIWSGTYLSYVGTQRFFGAPVRAGPWLGIILASWVVSLYFTVVEPNYGARLRLSNVVMTLLFAVHARLLYRQGMNSFAKLLAFSVLLTIASIQIMRFVTTFTHAAPSNNLDMSLAHSIFVLTFAFAILLFSISTVLMATDKLRAELEHLATRDSLTNALTRRSMNDSIDQELQRCKRSQRSMALLVMDLDHFKAINDSHGHQTGDEVLVRFVGNVNKLLRQVDQLGRFGGEEFVALLPETSLEEAHLVAERIRAVAASQASESMPACTVSIGITANSLPDDTVGTLLARADAAMYRAKANGRNRVETAVA